MQIQNNPSCILCSLHQTTDRVCVLSPYKKTEIMIIGEAPGANEARTGELFSGESGQLLSRILDEVGINREDCYIGNSVSCRPPENRTPSKKEIKACKYWVDYQFNAIKPKYVLLLGNTPLFSVLDLKGIRSLRGRPIEKDGVFYLPTYHPAYVLRDPGQEATFKADLITFKSIIAFKGIPKEESLNLKIVDSEELVKEMLSDIEKNSLISYDIETTGLYPWDKDAAITLFGVGTKTTQWSLPLEYKEGWCFGDFKTQKHLVQVIVKTASGAKMCAHNAKFDSLWLKVIYGVDWRADFDTMLAHYILDENSRHGLKELASVFLGAPNYDIDKDEKRGDTPIPLLAKYHAHDLYYTRKLALLFDKKLKEDEGLNKVFHDLLMPVARMFVDIEYNGVYVDTKKLDQVRIELNKRLEVAKSNMDKYAPDINWGSPKQVGEFLFDKLGLDPLDKTAGGSNSTSESVLKRLAEIHEVPRELMKYRECKQQLSFFIDGWQPWIVDSHLHPSFKFLTVTGRLSCADPNLQQVPRDPLIRSLLVAPAGWEFVDADLSQIELRIAAELAQETNMLHAFQTGEDVHWKTVMRELLRTGGQRELVIKTGSALLKIKNSEYNSCIEVMLKEGPDVCIKVDKAWKEFRKKAKAINFGFLYGMWWKKFILYARDNYGVNVTDREAQESREGFFELYPNFSTWHRKQINFVKRNGYVRTFTGRKRRLPAAMRNSNDFDAKEAQRQSINCLTEDTEMLTAQGWKTVNQLKIGEKVFSVNPNTEELELTKLQSINRGSHSGKMWRIDHHSISALVTPEHNWLVDSYSNGKKTIKLMKTEDLTMHGHDRLWIISKGLNTKNSLWNDDEVRLMGWVLTDGSYINWKKQNDPTKLGRSYAVGVTQNKPKYLKEIEHLFNRLGKHSHVKRKTGQHSWVIASETGKRLRKMMPNKTLTMEVLLSMTLDQRKLLLEVMCKGNAGWCRKTNRFRKFCSGSEERADAFLMLCTLSGQAARKIKRDKRHLKPKKYPNMSNIPKPSINWHIELVQNKRALPQHKSKWVTKKNCKVWCPTVKNGAWVAKRGNKVFITGNSPVQSFASDLNLMAALQMHKEFDSNYYKIIGTVHDSILMLIRKDKLKYVVNRVKEIMSRPELMNEFGINLSVPIEAEVTIGPWGSGISEKEYFKL